MIPAAIDTAVDAVLAAARAYADARAAELRFEDERPRAKQGAILRLLEHPNPLTGKPHSASSAEAVVETDADYLAYRVQQRAAVVATIVARATYEAAKLLAWACVQPEGTVDA